MKPTRKNTLNKYFHKLTNMLQIFQNPLLATKCFHRLNWKKSSTWLEGYEPYNFFSFFLQNIFHGTMSLDQLYFLRPSKALANYKTSFKGLFLCGSGTHPGGGVTGGPGRLAALTALNKLWTFLNISFTLFNNLKKG